MTPDWQPIVPLEELPELGGKEVLVNGERICLFKHAGDVFATSAECPHKGAPMAVGWVENGIVSCALHGWQFNLRSGECVDPCHARIKTYRVAVRDGWVHIGGRFDPDSP